MEIQVPEVPLSKIFSFLDAFSLLQVCQVNKYWNQVASNDLLWRKLCLRRWNCCLEDLDMPTWKQFYLTQRKLERRMEGARPEDFVYKEARGHLGILGPLAYLSGSGYPMSGQKKSIICTASSWRMLYAWDVQEGTMIWWSPVQPYKIQLLTTLPQLYLAFTVDIRANLKVWNCRDEVALATLTMPKTCCSLEAFTTDDGPVLMVGDSDGDIYTMIVPGLHTVSRVNAIKYSVEQLHCSPNKEWIFAGGTHQLMVPKVFFAQDLLRPMEGRAPLSVSLPYPFCSSACWALKRPNRITLMFRRATFRNTGFSTFDLRAARTGDVTTVEAHQIASFLLPADIENPNRMGVNDGNAIVFQSGPHLFLFSIDGLPLQRFDDHEATICRLWVDSLHVLTTSMDNYLHLYMWEEDEQKPRLKSCCHLEHRKGDLTPSCFESQAICDNRSIVCVVSRDRESSVLAMYSLNL